MTNVLIMFLSIVGVVFVVYFIRSFSGHFPRAFGFLVVGTLAAVFLGTIISRYVMP